MGVTHDAYLKRYEHTNVSDECHEPDPRSGLAAFCLFSGGMYPGKCGWARGEGSRQAERCEKPSAPAKKRTQDTCQIDTRKRVKEVGDEIGARSFSRYARNPHLADRSDESNHDAQTSALSPAAPYTMFLAWKEAEHT